MTYHDDDAARLDRLGAEALGTLDGRERAALRDHLAGCEACRRDLAELAEVVDALSLAAPAVEPPVGFESRVLRRVSTRVSRAWRPVAIASMAAALALGLVIGVGTGSVAPASATERPLASGATTVGEVYAVSGSPSWMVVATSARATSEWVDCVLVERSGTRASLGWFTLAPGGSSWSVRLPVGLSGVAAVRLVDGAGHVVAATTGSGAWR